MANSPVIAIGGSSGGAMTLLGTFTVSGGAVTTLTSSTINLSLYKAIRITGKVKSAGGAGYYIRLLYNGDTTATNYWNSEVYINNNVRGGGISNDPRIGIAYTGQEATFNGDIQKDVAGRPFYSGFAWSRIGAFSIANIVTQISHHVRDNTDNVTSISISSSVATQLDNGSEFTIWGCV